MNAVAITLIGVIGTGLGSAFFFIIRILISRFDRLEGRFGQLEGRLDNLAGDIHALDTKFTTEIKDLEIRMTDKFIVEFKALDTKFTGHLKQHGERLARIEAKLEIDPPAEAA